MQAPDKIRTFPQFRAMVREVFGEIYADSDTLWGIIESDAIRTLRVVYPQYSLNVEQASNAQREADLQLADVMEIQKLYERFCRESHTEKSLETTTVLPYTS